MCRSLRTVHAMRPNNTPKAQPESLEAVQKRAIHNTDNLTRGMPYSSMLLHVNLDSLVARREDFFRRFFP